MFAFPPTAHHTLLCLLLHHVCTTMNLALCCDQSIKIPACNDSTPSTETKRQLERLRTDRRTDGWTDPRERGEPTAARLLSQTTSDLIQKSREVFYRVSAGRETKRGGGFVTRIKGFGKRFETHLWRSEEDAKTHLLLLMVGSEHQLGTY